MTNKDSLTIGLVGSRAYEAQAWRSPGTIALEAAYWAATAPKKKVPLRSRLMRVVDAVAAAAVMAVAPTPK
jgi:hypothetical protein